MERAVLYIRLVVATTASAASALFVAIYCVFSLCLVPSRVHVNMLPMLTQYVVACRWYALFVPASLCAFGVFALQRWKNRAAFEIAVGCQWLFVVIWSALCLLAWMLPEIPYMETTRGAG